MEIKSINIEGLIKYNRIKAQDIKSEALIPKSLLAYNMIISFSFFFFNRAI